MSHRIGFLAFGGGQWRADWDGRPLGSSEPFWNESSNGLLESSIALIHLFPCLRQVISSTGIIILLSHTGIHDEDVCLLGLRLEPGRGPNNDAIRFFQCHVFPALSTPPRLDPWVDSPSPFSFFFLGQPFLASPPTLCIVVYDASSFSVKHHRVIHATS